MNLYQHTKNQFILYIFLGIQPILESCEQSGTPIFDYAIPNIFQSTSTFHESVSTCKKSGFLSFGSRDIVDLKIL